MARTYKRDSRGRFAGGGGGSSSSSKPRSSGGTRKPATARGRRQENERRAMAAVRAKGGPTAKSLRSVMVAAKAKAFYDSNGAGKAGKARKAPAAKGSAKAASGALARRESPGATATTRKAVRVNATPMQGPGKKPRIADTLRSTLRDLAQSDARFYREIEQLVGPIKVPKPARALRGGGGGGTSGGNQRGSVTRTLRDSLRSLARSDAARLREIADITRPTSAGAISGGKGGKRKGMSGSGASKALPSGKPKPKRKPKP